MSIIQLLLAAIFVLSSSSTVVWLSIPLIVQVIIDKNVSETLSTLGIFALAAILIVSILEAVSDALAATLHRRGLPLIWVQLTATLPQVLLLLFVTAFYSPDLAKLSACLSGIACLTYYLIQGSRTEEKKQPSLELLPFSFRLASSLIIFFIFWYGAYLVLKLQLTLGQSIGLCLINYKFLASLLKLTEAAVRYRKIKQGQAIIN